METILWGLFIGVTGAACVKAFSSQGGTSRKFYAISLVIMWFFILLMAWGITLMVHKPFMMALKQFGVPAIALGAYFVLLIFTSPEEQKKVRHVDSVGEEMQKVNPESEPE